MTDGMILALLGFVAVAITVLTPIIKLNSAIVQLRASIDNLADKFDDVKERVDEHEEKINGLEKVAVKHDVRLRTLEGRSNDD